MPSRKDVEKIGALVDETISEMLESEFNRNRGLTITIVEQEFDRRHSGLIARVATDWAGRYKRSVIADRLRHAAGLGAIKAAGKSGTQLHLPGIPPSILVHVLPLLAVPGARKGDELRHKPLSHVSHRELRSNCTMLKEHIDDTSRRWKAERYILKFIKDQPLNLKIPEACARAFAAAKSKTTEPAE